MRFNSITNEQAEKESRKKNIDMFGVLVSGNITQEKQENDDKGFMERTFRALKIDEKKIDLYAPLEPIQLIIAHHQF